MAVTQRQGKPLPTSQGMKHVQKLQTSDSTTSRDNCRVCGQLICFDIEALTGRLVRVNPDGSRHCHQEG